MIEQIGLSERHACGLVGLSRDAYRHPPEEDEATRALAGRIVEIAHERRRFGYRRVHDMVRPEFPGVNHKKVYRIYKEAGLAVRKRRKAKRPLGERQPLTVAHHVNEVWSMDFVSDSLVNGRRLKCLTVADDFSHEAVEIAVDFGIGGHCPGLPQGGQDRQRPGVHQPRVHRLVPGQRHPPSPHRAGQADAKRLHRKFQRQVQGRVPE
jgi:putative transposase